MRDLSGKVAWVTGASRGVGKGIALALIDAGSFVYVTSRTETELCSASDKCMALICDHRDDDQVENAFKNIVAGHGKLDILVNNVWGGYEHMIENGEFTWSRPLWDQPMWRWDSMFAAGVRAHYKSSQLAAKLMIENRSGLIVNISYWAAKKYIGNVAYGVSKVATDKMTEDMAQELKDYNVAVVSLYPGLVRTEKVLESAEWLDLSNSESPQFTGRAVACLANDPRIYERSGKVLVAAKLAEEYGFTDINGKRPRPLTLEDA